MSTPLTVTVTVHPSGSTETSLVPVYHVSVDQGVAGWEENFATIAELNAFLTGLRCGISFRDVPLGLSFIPTISDTFVHSRVVNRRPFQLWPEKPLDDES